jgi:hypothetical protein
MYVFVVSDVVHPAPGGQLSPVIAKRLKVLSTCEHPFVRLEAPKLPKVLPGELVGHAATAPQTTLAKHSQTRTTAHLYI